MGDTACAVPSEGIRKVSRFETFFPPPGSKRLEIESPFCSHSRLDKSGRRAHEAVKKVDPYYGLYLVRAGSLALFPLRSLGCGGRVSEEQRRIGLSSRSRIRLFRCRSRPILPPCSHPNVQLSESYLSVKTEKV